MGSSCCSPGAQPSTALSSQDLGAAGGVPGEDPAWARMGRIWTQKGRRYGGAGAEAGVGRPRASAGENRGGAEARATVGAGVVMGRWEREGRSLQARWVLAPGCMAQGGAGRRRERGVTAPLALLRGQTPPRLSHWPHPTPELLKDPPTTAGMGWGHSPRAPIPGPGAPSPPLLLALHPQKVRILSTTWLISDALVLPQMSLWSASHPSASPTAPTAAGGDLGLQPDSHTPSVLAKPCHPATSSVLGHPRRALLPAPTPYNSSWPTVRLTQQWDCLC